MKKIGTSRSFVMSAAVVFGLAMQVACSVDGLAGGKDANGGGAPAAGTPGGTPTTPPTPAPPAANPSDPMADAPVPPPGMAMIRAIHASADAPAVDAYVKGSPNPIVTNLGYGQTSGWIEVAQGSYEIELRAAPSKATDPIVYKTDALAIADGAMVSAVAAGLVGSNDADSSFRVLPVVEQFGQVPGGKALVRAIHAGADAPSVDLDVGNDDPTAPEVKGLERYASTGKEGVALNAGTALAIGIAREGSRVTAFTTPKLPSGGQLLVIATGLLAKLPRERAGFALLGIGPNGSVGFIKQDPIVYALHASPDAPAVDGFVGTAEIFDNLSFGQISKPIQVQPGEYSIDFYATTPGSMRPDSKQAAKGNTGALAAGERYLAEASGFLTQGSFQLLGYREGFDMNDDKAVLRAVHGSPDAPAVDIGTVSDGQIDNVLFSDLIFTKSSDDPGIAADQGHIVVGVGATGSTDPVAMFTLPARSGERAFTVAAGALAPKAGQKSFRLLIVDTAQSPWTSATLFPH